MILQKFIQLPAFTIYMENTSWFAILLRSLHQNEFDFVWSHANANNGVALSWSEILLQSKS